MDLSKIFERVQNCMVKERNKVFQMK